MKTIILHISDKVISRLKSTGIITFMTDSITPENATGIEAWKKVITAINNGEKEVTLQFKEEKA